MKTEQVKQEPDWNELFLMLARDKEYNKIEAVLKEVGAV